MSNRQPHRKTTAPKEHCAPDAELLAVAPETSMEFYSSPDGKVSLPVRFDGETAWATQAQMAELFGTSRRNVGLHLENAYEEAELDEATRKDFFQVQREGSRDVNRNILHYDLDAIISVGYRVHSPQGIHFRRWATTILRQRILDQNATQLRRAHQITESSGRLTKPLWARIYTPARRRKPRTFCTWWSKITRTAMETSALARRCSPTSLTEMGSRSTRRSPAIC